MEAPVVALALGSRDETGLYLLLTLPIINLV
jgi:hypothetical protein